jgi:hypothetical protein
MAGWKDILLDVLKLTDEVKRLNVQTEKLSDRTIEIDKRVVRLETMFEIAQKQITSKR